MTRVWRVRGLASNASSQMSHGHSIRETPSRTVSEPFTSKHELQK